MSYIGGSCLISHATTKENIVLWSWETLLRVYFLVPPPTLNITTLPIDAHFYAGLRLNLTCYIHLTLSSQSLNQHNTVVLSSIWSKSGIALNNSEQLSVEKEPVPLDSYHYKTSLVIQSLDAGRSHDGVYTCSVNIMSSNSFVMGGSAITQKSISVEGNHKWAHSECW